MYRQCTTEKTATQQKIFYEGLYQAMQDQLYSEISITDLCAQTGLSRNIFYRLFDCKEDVLFALIDSYFFICAQEVQYDSPEENLLTFFTFWRNQKDFLDLLNKNHMESLLSVRGSVCSYHINFRTQKLIAQNGMNNNIEMFSFYTSGFLGLILQWYHNDFSRSPEEMAERTLQFLRNSPFM